MKVLSESLGMVQQAEQEKTWKQTEKGWKEVGEKLEKNQTKKMRHQAYVVQRRSESKMLTKVGQ